MHVGVAAVCFIRLTPWPAEDLGVCWMCAGTQWESDGWGLMLYDQAIRYTTCCMTKLSGSPCLHGPPPSMMPFFVGPTHCHASEPASLTSRSSNVTLDACALQANVHIARKRQRAQSSGAASGGSKGVMGGFQKASDLQGGKALAAAATARLSAKAGPSAGLQGAAAPGASTTSQWMSTGRGSAAAAASTTAAGGAKMPPLGHKRQASLNPAVPAAVVPALPSTAAAAAAEARAAGASAAATEARGALGAITAAGGAQGRDDGAAGAKAGVVGAAAGPGEGTAAGTRLGQTGTTGQHGAGPSMQGRLLSRSAQMQVQHHIRKCTRHML